MAEVLLFQEKTAKNPTATKLVDSFLEIIGN